MSCLLTRKADEEPRGTSAAGRERRLASFVRAAGGAVLAFLQETAEARTVAARPVASAAQQGAGATAPPIGKSVVLSRSLVVYCPCSSWLSVLHNMVAARATRTTKTLSTIMWLGPGLRQHAVWQDALLGNT